MLIKRRVTLPGLVTRLLRSQAGIWFPEYDTVQPRRAARGPAGQHMNILALLGAAGMPGGRLIPGHNIVTNAGDLFYAQAAMGDALTVDFTAGKMVMCSAGTPGKTATYATFTPIASSDQAIDATYPKSNDDDVLNTGAGTDIASWRVSYLAATFAHAAITHGLISDAAPAGTDPLLTGFAFAAPFAKTVSDPLTVWVNHEFLGV